ncbi:4-hydroxy-tetrahydrodipicolinate reductase [Weeksellaceae bacterium TAE3-ERU29]|nr:4-hydroxy-tetrahydrodipicolinate reductase [Weeksellaceae bacterium TAE3-ERU29]
MNIAIVGYGKMGKTIERLAKENGHTISAIFNKTPTHSELRDNNIDVAIEFSHPEVAYRNLTALLGSNIPTVCGTTGWLDKLRDIEEKVEQYNGSFLYASNFSLGVNLFFEIVQETASLMKNRNLYDLRLEEIHHTQKKDAPSGTAITIAEKIIQRTSFKHWSLDKKTDDKSIPIYALREPEVPGTHIVEYDSVIDTIELKHTAKSRDGFALGAIRAAEYIYDKKGIFTMKDVLGL